ncbi:MAG: XRE family transcriptional regulator [Deltaproteobacteria bacterium]|nr:MAG: XRE family transcriptional regulator [Deltaproteobacteria bacterium]
MNERLRSRLAGALELASEPFALDASGEPHLQPGVRAVWGPLPSFGTWLREVRERRGLTLAAAAKGLGVSPPYLAKVERQGTAKAPDLALIWHLAETYRLDVREVLFEAGFAFEIDPGVVEVVLPEEREVWARFERAVRQIPLHQWEFLAPHKPGAPERLYKLFLRPFGDGREAWWAFEDHAAHWGPDEPLGYYRDAPHVYRGTANLLPLLQADTDSKVGLSRALRVVRERLLAG